MLTRRFDTAGPYGHVPGAAPPFHAVQNDPAGEAYDQDAARPGMSRLTGQDVDPLDGAGPVGVKSWDGTDLGYNGRDVTDPGTAYNESPGMFARLTQDAMMGQ